MNSSEKPAGLEPIAEQECLYLLGQRRLGRVAIDVDGRPQIFPVNYALSGRVVAFRTAPGTKLANAPMSHVAFEIDDYDSRNGVGWSVMVKALPTRSPTHSIGTRWRPAGSSFCPWRLASATTGWPSVPMRSPVAASAFTADSCSEVESALRPLARATVRAFRRSQTPGNPP